MKAITLWQPWASLLACGAKQYETRSWATSYRGPIAIHAASMRVRRVLKECFPLGEWRYTPDYEARRTFESAAGDALFMHFEELPLGAVIATAELVGCRLIRKNPYDGATHIFDDTDAVICIDGNEILFGDWTPGRYAWKFANMVTLVHPIPAKGGQRLWNWDAPAEKGEHEREGKGGKDD